MWCRDCGQDVPGIASPSGERVLCARCNNIIRSIEGGLFPGDLDKLSSHGVDLSAEAVSQEEAESQASVDISQQASPAISHDWEPEESMRRVQRLIEEVKFKPLEEAESEEQRNRFEPPHFQLNSFPAVSEDSQASRSHTHSARGGSPVAWLVTSLGLMVFACGAVLLGWSLFTARTDLWGLGMPLTLAGQSVLVLGLLMQLERVGRNNDRNASKIDQVDFQLGELKKTSRLLSSASSRPSQAFYSHLSEGASPQLLLSDLKSQLDLLGEQLYRR